MSEFRGHNQAAGWGSGKKGSIPQKMLVKTLAALIDASRAKVSSRTRDDARRTLREVMATANWNTPYVLRNIGFRRCNYLRGLGYHVPRDADTGNHIEQFTQWLERHG